MKFKRIILCFFIFTVFCLSAKVATCQNDTLFNKKRLYVFSGITATTYTGSMFMLNQLWYKQYSHSSFHFFDDSKEWLQMDKFGHSYSAYYLTSVIINGFDWSRLKHGKSVFLGSSIAFLAMSGIEVFDGYSSK